MTWTVETIEKNWIGGAISSLGLDPDEIVAAFSRVEERLGQPWLEEAHTSNGTTILGTSPTLRVVAMGQRLAAMDGVLRSEKLIDKIRRGDNSAEAELTAIYLVRYKPEVEIEIELEPPVGTRLADFRAREKDGAWTYVEVTFPDWSKATERAQIVLERVTTLVREINKMFALEVFLHREPSDEELNRIIATLPIFCNQEGMRQEELPSGLGLLFLNNTVPGQVVTDDHGDGPRPRIGRANAIVGPDQPHRHIAVRMAYSDQRAGAFLDSEAGQLPKDAPGLVMIGTFRAPGSIAVWGPLLNRQFELQLHTQVSGICLFGGGLLPAPKGQRWLPQTKVLVNPQAKIALPAWLNKALIAAGAEFQRSAG